MRTTTIHGFRYRPLLQPVTSRPSAEQVKSSTFYYRSGWRAMERAPGTYRTRRSRLSPEQRREILARIREEYRELHRDPVALAAVIAEGEFWDNALAEPVIEEE